MLDWRIFVLSCLVGCSHCALAIENQNSPLLHDGDRVNFVGNSITHGGHYINYITRFYLTRYPLMKVDFYNLGISGDTADGLVRRVETDILANDPTVVVMMIGMNDVGMGLYADTCRLALKEKRKERIRRDSNYQANIRRALDRIGKVVRDIVICTPSIYDQTLRCETINCKGTNDVLYQYGEYLKQIAPEYEARIVDIWHLTDSVNRIVQRRDLQRTIISNDRIHPSQVGGYIMAYQFLRDVGESSYVSDICIDGEKCIELKSFNADVSGIKSDDGMIEFDVLEKALPYPVDSLVESINPYIRFTEDFNREILRIVSLPEGEYHLMIDSIHVGKYTSKELSSGINLALNSKTPQYKQAVWIGQCCSEFWENYYNYRLLSIIDHRLFHFSSEFSVEEKIEMVKLKMINISNKWWRGIYDYYVKHKRQEAYDYKKLRQTWASLYDYNQPKYHRYRLVRIKK